MDVPSPPNSVQAGIGLIQSVAGQALADAQEHDERHQCRDEQVLGFEVLCSQLLTALE